MTWNMRFYQTKLKVSPALKEHIYRYRNQLSRLAVKRTRIHTCTHNKTFPTRIYIYRERAREREREKDVSFGKYFHGYLLPPPPPPLYFFQATDSSLHHACPPQVSCGPLSGAMDDEAEQFPYLSHIVPTEDLIPVGVAGIVKHYRWRKAVAITENVPEFISVSRDS